MQPAFYDPSLSYEENFQKDPSISYQSVNPKKRIVAKTHKFLGFEVNVPFGIPAGPLLNSNFMKAAFEWGFDVSTYKTVRSGIFPSHPFPNVLFVDTKDELHPQQTPRIKVANPPTNNKSISITNSFGVPSRPEKIWQKDVKKALSYVDDGQLMILSFMGTVKENQTQQEFIDDFVLAAKLSKETGVKVVEANLSCPNIEHEGLVCYNLDVTEQILNQMKKLIGNTPLIIKVGYYKNKIDLERLAKVANNHTQAIAAINTLQVEVVDKKGNQALPGKNRLKKRDLGTDLGTVLRKTVIKI